MNEQGYLTVYNKLEFGFIMSNDGNSFYQYHYDKEVWEHKTVFPEKIICRFIIKKLKTASTTKGSGLKQ